MEAGELEVKQAFEEVITRNVRASINHGNETRKLTKELQDKVTLLEGQLRQNNDKIEQLRNLIVQLQIKAYQGGT